jgi:putative ABC transport system permease protein
MTRSRLRAIDAMLLAGFSLRTRRLRAALASLGVAVGVGSMVAVLAVTASSQAELVAKIQNLGTNLLTIQQGSGLTGAEKELPLTVGLSVARVEGVESVSSTAHIAGVHVLRTDRVPGYRTAGLEVRSAEPSLITTLQGHLIAGDFLTPATERYRVAVLGYEVASALGISSLADQPQVWIGGRWFVVAGILDRLPLAPEVDREAIVGLPIAAELFGFDGHATRVYVRADPDRVATIARLLARTVDPTRPDQVAVSRPSDALTAQLAVSSSATLLYLGLGAIALFVGGVGVANVMFVSVIERRPEIGLRRALGATRRHIAQQFLFESILLAVLGGAVGAAGGAAATAGWAVLQGWSVVIPMEVIAGGLLAAAAVGGIAGLYPAMRAAKLPPVAALRGS